ncbi:hypothetical protein RQP46_009403 [Phenoliferia psychrophenolica]
MRRLFGLKKATTTPNNPTTEPGGLFEAGGPTGAVSSHPAPPPSPGSARPTQQHGLGLDLAPGDEQAHPVRKSRHVHYDEQPSEGSSSSSQPSSSAASGGRHSSSSTRQVTRQVVPPPLHPQPSFESRHGAASTVAGNCFPRSSSQSHPEAAAPTPQAPAPLRPAGASASTGPEGSSSLGHGSDGQRTTSPLSFSPSGQSYSSSRGASPYSYGVLQNPSLARLADRDPSQIYAPLTWSELAHDDLVQNISARERTRQEILWEVVASEERYVAELRSLVELYVNPLLHPLLSPPSSPPLPSVYSPTPSSYASSPNSTPPSSHSHSPLPIAARFARSDSGSSNSSNSPFGPWANHHHNGQRGESGDGGDDLPEIGGSEHGHGGGSRTPTGARSHASLPALPRNGSGPRFPSSPSAVSLAATVPDRPARMGMAKLAGFPGFRPRHPLKPPPGAAKLHKGKIPKEFLAPPPLPLGLRSVLEAIPEMLRGHEELSERLWVLLFFQISSSLSVGLSKLLAHTEKPWFLEVYAKYILSLEEALATIDRCLPSAHSPDRGRGPSKDDKRLAAFIMDCEERASAEGEASLAIALSKPLMRLGKLPLLMQSLLYHTDATTVEYEKTRAMALEVDALVRSIEDEKIEEDEREKVRDVLARIDGIKDKALMAPRSTRVLLEENPVHPSSSSNPPDAATSANPRRAVSESTPHRTIKASTASSSPHITNKKSTKRLSDLISRSDGGKNDWFVVFSDVTIRCAKVGTTDIPGGFSREKEKQGKQGKTKKKGKTRNLYRFIKVERWEMNDLSKSGLVSMEDIYRVRTSGGDTLDETTEDSDSEEYDDDDDFDTESRMSFTYEADDPQPLAPRNFKSDARPRSSTPKGRPSVSTTTRSVVAKQTPAKNKFGARGPSPGQRFQAPTAASLARAATPSAAAGRTTLSPTSRVLAPTSGNRPSVPQTTAAPTKRGLSSPAIPSSQPPLKNGSGGLHARDDSTMQMYEAYWGDDADAPPVPFPRS